MREAFRNGMASFFLCDRYRTLVRRLVNLGTMIGEPRLDGWATLERWLGNLGAMVEQPWFSGWAYYVQQQNGLGTTTEREQE